MRHAPRIVEPCTRDTVRARALTLVELLVAVAALTLIALGLSRVFAATGDTLRAGRKVSRLNEYAAMIERQMRRDFEQLSRDGFMVIRHRRLANGAAIEFAPDTAVPARERRGDEMVFFQTGSFTSARDPINPARQATGTAARVYFGHGLRWSQSSREYAVAPRSDLPRRQNNPNFAPTFGASGVNQYAADWTLLRHITILSGVESQFKRPPISGLRRDPYVDFDIQVGWQPAARSIFKFQAEFPPSNASEFASFTRLRTGENGMPLFASGIVDIATTDLEQIRSTTLDAVPPRSPVGSAANPEAARTADVGEDQALSSTASNTGEEAIWAPAVNPGTLTSPNMDSPTRRMQAWMIDALPAESDFGSATAERRMRYEPSPPDYLGTLGASGAEGQAFADTESWRRTDQTMLCASNFVPGCTEFIVEWSFGNVYPPDYTDAAKRGQLIWHGLPRTVNGDVIAKPYLASGTTTNEANAQRVGLTNSWVPPGSAIAVPNELIHFLPPGLGLNQNSTLYSCFGYLDPLYSSFSAGFDWVWPKLVRITMSLTDPLDPGPEQTFEFIFKVPQKRDSQ